MRSGREHEFLDSLYVMEEGMKHFYLKAMHLKRIKGKAELIDANILQAVSIAEKIAPYRHARLSAVKLAGDPNNPVRISDDASIEELKALVQMHLKRLAPVLDLEALMAPGDGIANRDCRSAERAMARRRRISKRPAAQSHCGIGYRHDQAPCLPSQPIVTVQPARSSFPLALIGTGYVSSERGTVLKRH